MPGSITSAYDIVTYAVLVVFGIITGYFLAKLYGAFLKDSDKKESSVFPG